MSSLACADDIRSNVTGEKGGQLPAELRKEEKLKGRLLEEEDFFYYYLAKIYIVVVAKILIDWLVGKQWKMSPSTCLPLIYSASAGTLPVFHMCWEQILFLGPANNGGMVRGNVGFWYNTNHWVICSRESSFATYLERINIRETALWLPSCYSFYQYMFLFRVRGLSL